MNGDSATGVLAVLGSILSVVSVLYGIAQALQKADSKYVATLQARVIEDGRRITALEHSLAAAADNREKLMTDLVRVTEMLMDAQRQLASLGHEIRDDIAQATGAARGAQQAAEKVGNDTTHINDKITDLIERTVANGGGTIESAKPVEPS